MLYGHLTPRNDADRFHTSFEAQYGWDRLGAVADTSFSFAPSRCCCQTATSLLLSPTPTCLITPGMFYSDQPPG